MKKIYNLFFIFLGIILLIGSIIIDTYKNSILDLYTKGTFDLDNNIKAIIDIVSQEETIEILNIAYLITLGLGISLIVLGILLFFILKEDKREQQQNNN